MPLLLPLVLEFRMVLLWLLLVQVLLVGRLLHVICKVQSMFFYVN